MSDFSKFRTSINGFNRTDVVNYVESMALTYQKELRQLRDENAKLSAENSSLSAEKDALTAQNESLSIELASLREQQNDVSNTSSTSTEPESDAEVVAPTLEEDSACGEQQELAAYRRAEQAERNAAARAKRLRQQLDALCDSARSRYQDTGEELSALAADLSENLSRLQDSVAEIQLIFEQTEDAFDALEVPETTD